jgi:hypothetical protein
MSTKSWIAVASAEHVRIGRSQGFMQVKQGGTAAPPHAGRPCRVLLTDRNLRRQGPPAGVHRDRHRRAGPALSSQYGRRCPRISPGRALERSDRDAGATSARKPVVCARQPELGLSTPVRPVPDRGRGYADHRVSDAGDAGPPRSGGWRAEVASLAPLSRLARRRQRAIKHAQTRNRPGGAPCRRVLESDG